MNGINKGMCMVHNCSQKQSRPVLWIEVVYCMTNSVIVWLTALLEYTIMQLQLHMLLVVHYISYSYMVQLLVMVSTHSLGPCSLMYRPESPDVAHVLAVFH